jgi:hypothetical protein
MEANIGHSVQGKPFYALPQAAGDGLLEQPAIGGSHDSKIVVGWMDVHRDRLSTPSDPTTWLFNND